ncbi:MAG: NADH-quinone oxidoreductase subunit NuoN, partial [Actinomycetales bacterium]
LLFPAAGDLLMMFIALEVMSLPLYLLAGMARRRRLLSQEAAMKYFLLGAFSSAFFLYGSALAYGFAGSIDLGVIAEVLAAKPSQTMLVLAAMAFILIGLFFKVSLVPFHQWTPDVYQGSPTPVTAFMAATVKIAAFGALLRVLYVAFGGLRWDWEPILWIVAIATMVVGSVIAVAQTDVKRMLAYSSIAQAGFILVGVTAASGAGLASSLFYLVTYGFTTIGAFAIITMVRDATGEATALSKWSGLGRKSPIVASLFALFMLSLAGIPLTSGFIGKFSVFAAAIESGAAWLVIVAVLMSAVTAFFYVRVIVLMFFNAPNQDTASVVVPSVFTTIAVAASATITVVLGIAPQPVLELVANADIFLR